eukprot:TRINITY_DN9971_c0_g1_i1.p1 TRINITY_DN9971_c0_g1~~TRINITY_DN9971_c0_g1_i1.p1  ORF type:complete len:317 (+),score=18.46 TRINITY_DN9971_c0_g1_i1:37-987(+)
MCIRDRYGQHVIATSPVAGACAGWMKRCHFWGVVVLVWCTFSVCRGTLIGIVDTKQDIVAQFHIPKTGGSALGYILAMNFCKVFHPKVGHSHESLSHAAHCSDHFLISRLTGWRCGLHSAFGDLCKCAQFRAKKKVYIVTTLRDPVALITSLHSHCSNGNWQQNKQCFGLERQGIDQLISSATNIQSKMLAQISWRTSDSTLNHTKLLEEAKKSLRLCSAVIFADDWDNSIKRMQSTFKWNLKVTSVPYFNHSTIQHPTVLSVSQKAAAKALNSIDYQLYSFAKQLFQNEFAREAVSLNARKGVPSKHSHKKRKSR